MNYELMANNKVYLRGRVLRAPEFSHEVFGEGFYEMDLSVQRLSDHNDIVPITVSERLLQDNNFEIGEEITVKGQFRSYNKIVDEKSKLMLTVFVRELADNDPTVNPNIIELSGYICKPPIYRTTPFKREICDVLIAVNRAYNKSDYIPCIAWGRNARFVKNVDIGQKVFLSGRIQSREYQKKLSEEQIETRTAYEISINRISLDNNFEQNDDDTLSDNIIPNQDTVPYDIADNQ